MIQAKKIENPHGQQDIQRKEIPDGHQELIRNLIQMHIIPQQDRQKAGSCHAQDIIYDERGPAVKQLIIKMLFCLVLFILHYRLLFSFS